MLTYSNTPAGLFCLDILFYHCYHTPHLQGHPCTMQFIQYLWWRYNRVRLCYKYPNTHSKQVRMSDHALCGYVGHAYPNKTNFIHQGIDIHYLYLAFISTSL